MQQFASQHMSATNNPALKYWFQILYFKCSTLWSQLNILNSLFSPFQTSPNSFFQIQLNNILPHVHSSENGLLLLNKCNFHLSSLRYCAHSCARDNKHLVCKKTGKFLKEVSDIQTFMKSFVPQNQYVHRGPYPEPDEFQSKFHQPSRSYFPVWTDRISAQQKDFLKT